MYRIFGEVVKNECVAEVALLLTYFVHKYDNHAIKEQAHLPSLS